MITIEEQKELIEKQKELIEKQKELAQRIKEYLDDEKCVYKIMYLGKEDCKLIQRALACHMAVVTLDMERRGGKDV